MQYVISKEAQRSGEISKTIEKPKFIINLGFSYLLKQGHQNGCIYFRIIY
jgi:hypothetical protein